jgi:hypothetical protein
MDYTAIMPAVRAIIFGVLIFVVLMIIGWGIIRWMSKN